MPNNNRIRGQNVLFGAYTVRTDWFPKRILSLSTVQNVRKWKSRGVFREHELDSNSYEQRARPHQLHPLLGCHRHSWKEKSLVKKVTPSSPFNWVPFFQPLSLPPILPLRSHLLNRKADVWQLHGHKNEVKIVWLRRIAAERFFFLLGEVRRASRKKTSKSYKKKKKR